MLSNESLIGLKKLLKNSTIKSMKIEMVEYNYQPKYCVQFQILGDVYTVIGDPDDLDIVDVLKHKALVVESTIKDND